MSVQPASRLAETGGSFRSAHVPDNTLVLAGRSLRPGCGAGPLFGDDVWDLSPASAVPNRRRSTMIVRFDTITDPVWRLTAKEYAYARLTRAVEGSVIRPSPLTLIREISFLRRFFRHLHRYRPGLRLADISDDDILDGFLAATSVSARWQAQDRAQRAWTLHILHRLGDQLTYDKLEHIPWHGQTAGQIAGSRPSTENATPRIPPGILGPYLRGALFYLQIAAPDILSATEELAQPVLRPRRTDEGPRYTRDRLAALIEQRRAQGRGLPASSPWANDRGEHETGVNLNLVARLIGVPRSGLKTPGALEMIRHAAAEIGTEPGGMDTPVSADPATGTPWRGRFCPHSIALERSLLMTACYVVIAYLSGLRDSEVQSLRRGCYFREDSPDGVISRHKIRGTVFKGRKPSGDSAIWVVIEPVATAIDVLEQLTANDYLFTPTSHQVKEHLITAGINDRLNVLRDRISQIRPHDPVPDLDGTPWRFTTRQFRRTIAWHIAHQPFGVVAGKIQYKHAQVAIFEGYAGSSASGFPAEIEDERRLARLETFLDRYEDFKAGATTTPRLASQFTRIRDELGDFPGRVIDPSRLRAMLANAARTYYPGVLNDCYFDAATALCIRHKADSCEPAIEPVMNHCQPALCRNSCVTDKHHPAIRTVISGSEELLSIQKLSAPQRTALQQHIASMKSMLVPRGSRS